MEKRGNPDQRTARRYDLSLPIEVLTVLPEQAGPLRGRTRDVSTAGVYFIIDQEFTPGSELEFTLTLPAETTRGTDVFDPGASWSALKRKRTAPGARASLPLSKSITSSEPNPFEVGTLGSVKIRVEISGAYGHGLGRDLATLHDGPTSCPEAHPYDP
jgi:hypothetical protein